VIKITPTFSIRGNPKHQYARKTHKKDITKHGRVFKSTTHCARFIYDYNTIAARKEQWVDEDVPQLKASVTHCVGIHHSRGTQVTRTASAQGGKWTSAFASAGSGDATSARTHMHPSHPP
jgi:hypothetical protein